ncbi:MAG: universal stress protein [Trueperaceae bacterium]|nr:MAG: universal stress protein [Trueperaceae bacterium]
MFKEILVPIGKSVQTHSALDVAVSMAAKSYGSVILLHVIEMIKDTAYEDFQAFYEQLAAKARREMEQLAEPHRDGGVLLEQKILYGRRVQEILRFSEERAIDLIVMQSHRVDPADPTRGWNTISYKVGILSRCPVMLVK